MKNDSSPINVADLEEIAAKKLPTEAYDYYASGADDEVALRANIEAYARRTIHHRVLVDVSERATKTRVLGVGRRDADPRRADRVPQDGVRRRRARDGARRASVRARR